MQRYPVTVIALGAMVSLAVPVWAQQNPVVVELYTSQGCAACPPADVLLDELAAHREVLPLALHVDYWDYIGWADTFGQPAFSERQKSYARKMGRKSVYTPQMVIGGVDDVQGNATLQVTGLIAEHQLRSSSTDSVTVAMAARPGGGVTITARAQGPLEFATDVQLVHFLDTATVEILAGENAGREMTYRNIVTDWAVIGVWDGVSPFSFTVTEDVPNGSGLAVVVQEQGLGPVLGAARYP